MKPTDLVQLRAEVKAGWYVVFIKRGKIYIEDPENGKHFIMTGHFHNLEEVENLGDHKLVKQGYITIVPHKIDNTDYSEIERLSGSWKI